MEESRPITSKANLWADLGSRGQMAAAVRQAAACGLRGAREVAVCPEWPDMSALCTAARVRDRPAPRPARYESAGAAARARPVPCRGASLRFLCAANADMTGGGSRQGCGGGWCTASTGCGCCCRYRTRSIPAPSIGAWWRRGWRTSRCVMPRAGHIFGRQASHKSIGKYVSSVRAWYRRFYKAELGLGARGSRIVDILKGYGRLTSRRRWSE